MIVLILPQLMTSEYSYILIAKIALYSTENGGRKKPVQSGYRPSFSFNSLKHYSGEIQLLDKIELRPGESSLVTIKLLPARTIRKTLKKNDAFTITEGNKVIGSGVIEQAALTPQ